jgi:hypothetical protein
MIALKNDYLETKRQEFLNALTEWSSFGVLVLIFR